MYRRNPVSDKYLKELNHQVLYFSFDMEQNFYQPAMKTWNANLIAKWGCLRKFPAPLARGSWGEF
jgi:hypothetical protein